MSRKRDEGQRARLVDYYKARRNALIMLAEARKARYLPISKKKSLR